MLSLLHLFKLNVSVILVFLMKDFKKKLLSNRIMYICPFLSLLTRRLMAQRPLVFTLLVILIFKKSAESSMGFLLQDV